MGMAAAAAATAGAAAAISVSAATAIAALEAISRVLSKWVCIVGPDSNRESINIGQSGRPWGTAGGRFRWSPD
jgi:hypothetical protein